MITLTSLLTTNLQISRNGFPHANSKKIFRNCPEIVRMTLIKDYDGNDPVEEGWYDWHNLESLSQSAPKFRILIKSDKSRQMYGFKAGIDNLFLEL